MQTETTALPGSDQQAVDAVRKGDLERYRELVERHERLVYAVAWSRLGDASLAEEVTQETFIRGYQRLPLLADGAKFASWIASIARNAAINLGLRHRRELDKRERWALEAERTNASSDASELCTPETLRQTLANLPSAHRECLVLFYLERKSNLEAAASLGISEATFRVRLHRARAVLRERLEEQLAQSLEELRPQKQIAPAVITALISSPTAKATGSGLTVKILPALAKILPFKWLAPFLWAIILVPGMLMNWWIGCRERRNYRDQEGFRVRMHRDFSKGTLWFVPLLLIGLTVITRSTRGFLTANNIYLLMGSFTGLLSLAAFKQLTINRSRHSVATLVYVVVLAVGQLAVGFERMPANFLGAVMLLASLMMSIIREARPLRMDYNLFLRAADGMLPLSDAPHSRAAVKLRRPDLVSFARFLGERLLVINFRWNRDGMQLRLAPVKPALPWRLYNFLLPIGDNRSNITLHFDGTVSARFAPRDEQQLVETFGRDFPGNDMLLSTVESSVAQSWEAFRNKDFAKAEEAVGQTPDSELFLAPPEKVYPFKWLRWILLGAAGIGMVSVLLTKRPELLSGLHPLSVTEAEIRSTLEKKNDAVSTHALSTSFVFPPTNLFAPDALHSSQQEFFQKASFDPNASAEVKFRKIANEWLFQKAMNCGFIGWEDVHGTPLEAAKALRKLGANRPAFLLTQRESTREEKKFTIESVSNMTLENLRWLKEIGCLDLIDREKLIEHIRSRQIFSGDSRPGEPKIPEWRSARGMFYIPNWPVIQDTYIYLSALEILGGLDKIDREACIEGILKLHRGKGFFSAPQVDYRWALNIRGDVRDTFCAFESLRILGALDRVKDLDQWQFRPAMVSKQKPDGSREVTWDEMEAWTCQQRLARYLGERNINPTAVPRPLSEP